MVFQRTTEDDLRDAHRDMVHNIERVHERLGRLAPIAADYEDVALDLGAAAKYAATIARLLKERGL